MKKNIAVSALNFGWGGGADLLNNIILSLINSQSENNIKIYLFIPVDNKIDSIEDFFRVIYRFIKNFINYKKLILPKKNYHHHKSLKENFNYYISNNVDIVYYSTNPNGLLKKLKKLKIDIIFPINGSLGENFPIPWIGYILDFQHKVLFNNFIENECFQREIFYNTILKDASRVIVNSIAVSNDIKKYYPWYNKKIISLPFYPFLSTELIRSKNYCVKEKYKIKNRYFIISNQFWEHKNHLTAFKAFNNLSNKFDVSLVCTGALIDSRRPTYIKELLLFVEQNKLKDKILILGHISKTDQIELMKKSIALIQPTLFEGGPGGGSVYDAIALGIPILLSDIIINKEISSNNVKFFPPTDSDYLTELMTEAFYTNNNMNDENILINISNSNAANLGNFIISNI